MLTLFVKPLIVSTRRLQPEAEERRWIHAEAARQRKELEGGIERTAQGRKNFYQIFKARCREPQPTGSPALL